MAPFRGWSPAALDFYRALEADNSRSFWTEHKDVWEAEVRAPFDALAEQIEDEFGPLRVFRPQRDTRFSHDKSPYKTRCYGVATGPAGESFYVEISAEGLVAGTGYWMMAGDQLARYRAAVDDPTTGDALVAAVAAVEAEHLAIDGHALKTAPRGYPRDHPRVDLLRFKSVAAVRRFPPARWLATKAAGTRIVDTWRAGAPLNAWLGAHVGPSLEPPPETRYRRAQAR